MNTTDLPEHVQNLVQSLTSIKAEIYNLAFIQVMEGELKPLANQALGESYPYDYNLYMQESIDPDVIALMELLAKTSETLSTIEANYMNLTLDYFHE